DHARADPGAAPEMRQVRADGAIRRRAGDRVAARARLLEDEALAALRRRIRRRGRRRALLLDPGVELIARYGADEDAHPGVLRAAELGAGALEAAGALGRDPHDVGPRGDGVLLVAEARHPEAVDDVGTVDFEPERHADGHDQLVGGDDPLRGVLVLPPPLVA